MQKIDGPASRYPPSAPLGLRGGYASLLGPYNSGRGGRRVPTIELKGGNRTRMQTMEGGTVPTKGGLLGAHPTGGGVPTEIQNLAPKDDYRRGGFGLPGRREESCNEEEEPYD